MSSDSKSQRPLLDIIVDARQFDEETFQEAAEELQPYFAVNGGPAIKLSEQLPLVIVITFILSTFGAVAVNLVSSVLYDWLKKWATHSAHSEKVTVVLKVLDGKNTINQARIAMPDTDESMKKALATISEFLEDSQQLNQPSDAKKTRKKAH